MFIMAMSVGYASVHGAHHSLRGGPAVHTHASFQNMSVTPSAQKWPHLVQHPARGFSSLSSLSKPVVTFQVQRRPPHDTCDALIYPEAKYKESPLSSVSQESPSSEKIENLVQNPVVPLIQLCLGEFVENRRLYRQKYVIRSYQVGADKATSITTIFRFFQDVSLCHFHFMGIAARDGFGATKAMNRLGLIWVMAKMHVEVESFPKWPDVIEIDCSIARAGKNGVRYDWIVRRYGTNEVLVRASSIWCTMDSTTRRVCKMPHAVRAELDPFIWDDRYVFQQREHDILSSDRIPKLENLTAKYMTPDLKSSRTNLDVNQHVTNASYISWLLQSLPGEHIETHSLTSITIEYRRECQSEDVFESLTSSKKMLEQSAANPVPAEGVANSGLSSSEFTHLLRTQDMAQHEIARARTTWRSKPSLSA